MPVSVFIPCQWSYLMSRPFLNAFMSACWRLLPPAYMYSSYISPSKSKANCPSMFSSSIHHLNTFFPVLHVLISFKPFFLLSISILSNALIYASLYFGYLSNSAHLCFPASGQPIQPTLFHPQLYKGLSSICSLRMYQYKKSSSQSISGFISVLCVL